VAAKTVVLSRPFCSSVIRTAPFFTNVKTLWQSHLKLNEGKDGSAEAYAHVDANMVRLPFACAIGKESLLQTMVESEVPVKVSEVLCTLLILQG
jgi:hypothetical protein